MIGVIESYRRGKNAKKCDSVIVSFKEKNTTNVVGKKAIWTSPAGRRTEGKVTKQIGNKGNVIVKFKFALPGQAIGTQIEIN